MGWVKAVPFQSLRASSMAQTAAKEPVFKAKSVYFLLRVSERFMVRLIEALSVAGRL